MKLDLVEEIELKLFFIKAALDESDDLAKHAMKRLDELSRDGKEARANVSARPSMAYETFSRDVSQFPTLQNIQQELFERFADKNAADGCAA